MAGDEIRSVLTAAFAGRQPEWAVTEAINDIVGKIGYDGEVDGMIEWPAEPTRVTVIDWLNWLHGYTRHGDLGAEMVTWLTEYGYLVEVDGRPSLLARGRPRIHETESARRRAWETRNPDAARAISRASSAAYRARKKASEPG